ncbi:MBL fold metallo-hydrolase [bacterium]|nr:MBL fold metallo-hydrolase [bacterium]
MITEITVKGYFKENCFFYIDEITKHGFIIDPGAQADLLLSIVRRSGWTLDKILLTHGHFDHMGAADEIRRTLHIPIVACSRADEYLLDAKKNLSALCGSPIIIEDTEHISDGGIITSAAAPALQLKAIYVPGHTGDSVMYFSESERAAFVGDTIFKGSLGAYHYPGGDPIKLRQSIIDRVFSLPDDTALYSGHSEKTTVGAEKRRYSC